MTENSFKNLCIFHVSEGLREGLSHFSEPSRVALIYATEPDDSLHMYDPQNLLDGHESVLGSLYLDSNEWRESASDMLQMNAFEEVSYERNLKLSGLISYGGRSASVFYQMWFTEHHPNICSTGPIERWLEHAVWLLSQDIATKQISSVGTSGYALREYAAHAVRDYILDRRSTIIGWDTQLRVYPILDAVLGISETLEEGMRSRGQLIFVEPAMLSNMVFVARFPLKEQPSLKNFKHVRKLLQAVEHSDRKLVSDGKSIVGIASGGYMPEASVIADFRGGHGFLRLDGGFICSFSDGNFHSSNRKANLAQAEEILLESKLDTPSRDSLFRVITRIVQTAQDEGYGCTLVVDLNEQPLIIPGQHLERPLDIRQIRLLELGESLAKLDGALHIGADLKVHGFGCLLDGHAVPGEDRARGARFNSALRFTAKHRDIFIVVVSSDRPVSIIQEGVELNARCDWKPASAYIESPPTLEAFWGERIIRLP